MKLTSETPGSGYFAMFELGDSKIFGGHTYMKLKVSTSSSISWIPNVMSQRSGKLTATTE